MAVNLAWTWAICICRNGLQTGRGHWSKVNCGPGPRPEGAQGRGAEPPASQAPKEFEIRPFSSCTSLTQAGHTPCQSPTRLPSWLLASLPLPVPVASGGHCWPFVDCRACASQCLGLSSVPDTGRFLPTFVFALVLISEESILPPAPCRAGPCSNLEQRQHAAEAQHTHLQAACVRQTQNLLKQEGHMRTAGLPSRFRCWPQWAGPSWRRDA